MKAVLQFVAVLAAASVLFGQVKERPVGLVLAAGGGKWLRAGAELPLTAKDGDVLYAGDGVRSAAASMTLLYCPERVQVKLEPSSQVTLDSRQLRLVTGRIAERTAVEVCLLPELERTPAASQQHYGESMTRALKVPEAPLRSRIEEMQPAQRAAFEAELERIDKTIAANPKDKAARVARAALFEKYNLAAEALEEYRKIVDEWPDAIWAGSRIFVHSKEQGRAAPPLMAPRDGKVYALLIGISKYQRLREQEWLRYAHQDANVLNEYLRSPRGGGLPESSIVLLTDEKATTAAIRNAFETFLKARAGKNDTVVIFIAAHGVVESTGRRGAYIVTHDSDPEDLASTALPMADVQTLIREDLSRVGHVLVYVDVCRAGNIGAMRGANTVNKVVEQLAEAEGDLFIFLASGPKEVSYEGPQYGGGHGAFSYFLLDGMNGAADTNQDTIVSIGEVIEYVRERVVQGTNGRQHPRDLGSMEHAATLAEMKHEGIPISKSSKALPVVADARTRGQGAGPGGSARAIEEPLPTRELDEAIRAVRMMPDEPQNAFGALRALRRQLNPEQYLLQENKLRVALENQGQQILLRYLAGEQTPQTRADFLRGAAYFEAAKLLTPESLFLDGRTAFCHGRARLFDKDYRRAVDLLERAARIDPAGGYSYNALGIAYLEQADYANAVLAFRDAIRHAPNWAYPLHNLALVYTQTGDYDAAIRAYQQAMQLAPRYSYLAYNLGLLYQKLNRRKEAEAAYRKAMTLDPANAEPYNGLGLLYASAGRFAEAERLYRQALEKNAGLFAARHNLALLLASKADRADEAPELWRQNLAQAPDYIASRLALARSLARQGQDAEAIREYQAILNQKSDYVAARLALADLLARRNDPDASLAQLQAALKLQPDNAAIHERIGDLEASRNRHDAAQAAYQVALGYAPDSGARKRIRSKMRA